MRYNVEALLALAEAQKNRKGQKPTTILVAGTVADILPHLPENFRVLGYRENLEPLIAAADVAFNPTLGGSGSNTKLVELFARGLPVVTTEFGLRGFEALRPLVSVAALEEFDEALEVAKPRCVQLPSSFHWDSIAATATQDLRSALGER